MKVWCCSCVDCQYICNFQVYTGKKGEKSEKGQGRRVVKELMKPFTGAWRELTTDNFFTSRELSDDLYSDTTTFTGTVRLNKPDLPADFTQSKGRKPDSVLVGYNGKNTLTSFIDGNKKKPVVVLTSTLPQPDVPTEKPSIVLHYNATKGAVDAGDFITRKTNCVRKTRVWTKKLIMELLSIASLNASCLFRLKYPHLCKSKCWRSEFLKELCNELILDNVIIRESCKRTKQELRTQLHNFASRSFGEYAKLCNYCSQPSRGIKVCSICSKTVCKDHSSVKKIPFCTKCCQKQLPAVHIETSMKRSRCQKCKKDRKTSTKCAHCQQYICTPCQKPVEQIICEKCSISYVLRL